MTILFVSIVIRCKVTLDFKQAAIAFTLTDRDFLTAAGIFSSTQPKLFIEA